MVEERERTERELNRGGREREGTEREQKGMQFKIQSQEIIFKHQRISIWTALRQAKCCP